MSSKKSFEYSGAFRRTEGGNMDYWYGGGDVAWPSIQAARDGVPMAIRSGKTVGVAENGTIVEYVWHPTNITNAGLVKRINKGDKGDQGEFNTDNLKNTDNTLIVHILDDGKSASVDSSVSVIEQQFNPSTSTTKITLAFAPVQIFGLYLDGLRKGQRTYSINASNLREIDMGIDLKDREIIVEYSHLIV